MTGIQELVRNHETEIIELRRYFRMYPEPADEEYNTQRKIKEKLTQLGLEPVSVAGAGVMADIRGQRPGASAKIIALRANMDAMQVEDEIDRPCQSQNYGWCHAAGHDGHIAILLGVAKVLTEMRREFSGVVRLLFQPGREPLPGGAQGVIEDGALRDVTAIFGMHLRSDLPVGALGYSRGRMMAESDEFTVQVRGKEGDSSAPCQAVSALTAAAQIVAALPQVAGQYTNPLEPSVISVGMLQAGESFHTIPATAVIRGTVRTFDQATRDQIFAGLERLCHALCGAISAECTVNKTFGCPPVINDKQFASVAAAAGAAVLGQEAVREIPPVMVGDDFSTYQQLIPGVMIFIGAGNRDNAIYPQQHPRFDIDEAALRMGTGVLAETVVRAQNS
ncbi:M20 metallopeptidase family protein [Acetonema longum]|uniref:N-acyl-L-amino acid amidohydrolase n=1 Tax=Acetonema longum DSM 6540 TaxID=1009370 RepID=F7NQ46_9FIRM|nr:amidohydrolase [Acetonema longum]EGO61805.1 N-acyl-L-amino acid amidohydrolase [Acetonema longum DSM 6540]